MGYTKLDMETFPRRLHFDFFKAMEMPHLGITANVDVTDLLKFCKEHKYSFYLVFMHAAALAANSIPELRQRILGDGVVEYDDCPTSHTELQEGGTFCYCTLHHNMPFDQYIVDAEERRQRSRTSQGLGVEPDKLGQLFTTTVPWVHYTSLQQPLEHPLDSNPRIAWGKFQADHAGRLQMPVTLMAHHALVDGVHLGMFYQNLEQEMKKIIG